MLSVTRKGPDRVDIAISGKVHSDEMKRGLDELISQSQGITHGKMLYRITDLQFPSLGAMGVELSLLPGLFKLIGKYDRMAVVADKEWLRKVSELEGALIPGLDIKAFDLNATAEAEAWLAS